MPRETHLYWHPTPPRHRNIIPHASLLVLACSEPGDRHGVPFGTGFRELVMSTGGLPAAVLRAGNKPFTADR